MALTITNITQATSAVVTVNTTGSNPFATGNLVAFAAVVGMTQINGTNGTVIAIGGSSGAYTATFNINSSAYTAYSSGGTATILTGVPISGLPTGTAIANADVFPWDQGGSTTIKQPATALFVYLNPQTAAETAASVTPTNYAYPPGHILRYGTNTTPGTTDMTAALQAAVNQAGQSQGAAVYVPKNLYAISSAITYTLSSSIASLTINGDGAEATIIKQTASANAFAFTLDYSTQCVHIRGMTLTTTSTNSGNAIQLTQSGSVGDNALSDITNVTCRGADGYGITQCWAAGCSVTSMSNINFNGFAVWGGATQTGEGVIIQGTSSVPAFVYNFSGCTFNTLNIGINYNNYCQGVTVSQSNFTGDTIGIFCPSSLSGLEQLSVTQSQFECYTSGISLNTCIENTTITDNLFLVGLVNNGTGVNLGASGLFSITGNTFTFQSAGTTNKIGVLVNGNTASLPGVITGNVFQGLAVGIDLLSGSAYVNVQSNAYSGNTTNVGNAGTSNTLGGGST